MVTLQEIASRCEGVKWKSGNAAFESRCPGHNDKNPSFGAKDDGGKILLYCQGGCNTADVLRSMSLQWSDVFDSPPPNDGIEFRHRYSPGLRKTRPEKVNGEKKPQYWEHSDESTGGKWVRGQGEHKAPLYNIHKVIYTLPSMPVFITEGERDADNLTALGLPAICNPNGAGERNLREKYGPSIELLRGRDVVIIPDRDDAGEKLVEEWTRTLSGIAKSIKVVRIPTESERAPGKPLKDVSDYLAVGHTAEELERLILRTEFLDGCLAPIGTSEKARISTVVSLRDFLSKGDTAIEWLAEDLLPLGGLSLNIAPPKVGKSTVARDLARCVLRGEPFLSRTVRKGSVLLIAIEDHEPFLKRQLRGLGLTEDDPLFLHVGPVPMTEADPVAWLRLVIEQHKPSLVVVDTLMRFVSIEDANDYAKVTEATAPLAELARDSGSHIMLIHHAGKGGAYLGSTAFYAIVDTKLELKKDGDRRIVSSEQRYGVPLPETIIEMEESTGMIAIGKTVEEQETETIAREIVAVVSAAGYDGVPEAELREKVGGDRAAVARVLRQMTSVKGSGVARVGEGKRGNPFRYVPAEAKDSRFLA